MFHVHFKVFISSLSTLAETDDSDVMQHQQGKALVSVHAIGQSPHKCNHIMIEMDVFETNTTQIYTPFGACMLSTEEFLSTVKYLVSSTYTFSILFVHCGLSTIENLFCTSVFIFGSS